jgi:hypothetical protein
MPFGEETTFDAFPPREQITEDDDIQILNSRDT